MQPGVRNVGLRLHTDTCEHRHIARLCPRVVQQRRLSDPGISTEHEHPASPLPRTIQQRDNPRMLVLPTTEHRFNRTTATRNSNRRFCWREHHSQPIVPGGETAPLRHSQRLLRRTESRYPTPPSSCTARRRSERLFPRLTTARVNGAARRSALGTASQAKRNDTFVPPPSGSSSKM